MLMELIRWWWGELCWNPPHCVCWINSVVLQATVHWAGEWKPHKLDFVWESITIGSSALRRESHYGENDGDGDVTFCRSHFTFCTVTVAMSLMWREHRRGIGCHGDGNSDGQGQVWQNAKAIFCWCSKRKSEQWLQELRDSDGNSEHNRLLDGDSCARGNGARLCNGEKVDPQSTMSAIFSLCYY